MAKRIARLTGLVIGIVAALAAPLFRAQAADTAEPKLKLVLVETVAEAAGGRWTSVAPGAISEASEAEGRAADYGWSAPPPSFGEEGFELTLTTGAQAGSQAYEGGTRAAGTDFKFDPDPAVAELKLEAGQSDTVTVRITVAPRWGLTDGEIVDLAVGVQWGPSVHYRYRVTYEQPDRLAHDEDDLEADLDCARRIEISHLPSLNCHISISGWKRDGGPVQVVLPEALDAFGNHDNGIQVSGAGERAPASMGEPYGWGLMIFACPGTQGPGVNCDGHTTAPGLTETPIVVRQEGRKDVTLMLELEAEGEALAGGGGAVAPGDTMPPQGALEARLDCPSTISISAPQGISCNIVISNCGATRPIPSSCCCPARSTVSAITPTAFR